MGFNSKELKVISTAKEKTNPSRKDRLYLPDVPVIVDDMGQWAHPGMVTQVNSPNITMKGVNWPVTGVSNTGDVQHMYPGENYKFNGNNVTEFPHLAKAAKGGQIDPEKALAFLQTKSIYGHPLTPAQMKSFALAAGVQLDENGDIIEDEEGEPIQDDEALELPEGSYEKRGGSTRGRRTSKNIKSSVNELLTRNAMLYGPSGKNNIYDPRYDDGGSTMPYVHYQKAGQIPAWVPEQYRNVPAPSIHYTENKPAYDPSYGIPKTGVVIDKRTNKAYYTGDKGEKGSFNVLTGKNPDLNKNLESLDYLDKHPEMRNTPKGYYLMHPQEPESAYNKQHYKGMVRPLTPIPAYGMKAPLSDAIAFHRVYAEHANDPNDTEYNRRMRLINQSNATLRCGSYGCTNVTEESYQDVNRALPKTDTALVIDSRNYNDLMKLRYIQEHMKNTKKQGGLAFPQQPTADQFYARGYVPNVPANFYREGGLTKDVAFPQQPGADMFFSGYPFQPEYAQGGMPCMDCGGYMDEGGQASPFGYGQFPPAMAKGGQAAFARAMKKFYADGGQAPQGSTMEQNYMTDVKGLKRFIGGNVMNAMANDVYGQEMQQPVYDYGGENTFDQGQFNMINSVQQGLDYSNQQAQNQRHQAMQSLGQAAMQRAQRGKEVKPYYNVSQNEVNPWPNPNQQSDSLAVNAYMNKNPQMYDPNKRRWETNKAEDQVYYRDVNPNTGKPGSKKPYDFNPKNYTQVQAIKQAMNNVAVNNSGQPLYNYLYGQAPVEPSMTNRQPGGESTKAEYDAWMKKADADYYAKQSGQENPEDHTKGAVNNIYYVDQGRQSYNPGYRVKARGWSGDQSHGNQWKSKGTSDSPFPYMGSGFMGQGEPQSQGQNPGAMSPQQAAAMKEYYNKMGMDFTYDEKRGLLGQLFKGLGPKSVHVGLRSQGQNQEHPYETGVMPSNQPNTNAQASAAPQGKGFHPFDNMRTRMAARKQGRSADAMSDADAAQWDAENVTASDRQRLNPAMNRNTAETPEAMANRKAWEKAHGFAHGGIPSMYLPYGYQVGGMPMLPQFPNPSLAPLNQQQQGGQSDNDEDDFEYMDERQIAAFMAAGGVIKYLD